MDLKTFGGRVRALRLLVPGLSQQLLDRLARLHRGHCWQIEQLRRENTERETVEHLAGVFGCSVGWLLVGEGTPVVGRPELSFDEPGAVAAYVRDHLGTFEAPNDRDAAALRKLLVDVGAEDERDDPNPSHAPEAA